jgi:secretion/DNA translocation related TadE-like protein
VWIVLLGGFLASLTVVAMTLGQAVIARHRAGSAADLAALAAAGAAPDGGFGCRLAERVVSDQGARLVTCVLSGEVADVVVEVRTRAPVYLPAARARSRAGPPTQGV